MTTSAADTPPYAIPQEFEDFRETIRKMVVERVAPRAAEIDETAEYPRDIRELFAAHDLMGLPFETEHGGTGTGTLMLNIAVEEVAKACASSALILMIQELGTLPIKLFGTDELKQRFLPRCASGEWSPAFALSEPDAGSDPGGMRTRAVRDGDEWVIDGTKNWITNLGVADFYICFAVTDPEAGHSRGISAFVVEADRPGFSVGKLEHKMGIRGSPTGQPIFDHVRVPAANLIGEENEGFKVAMATLDRSRLGVAAQAVGIAQGATDYAAAYAQERQPVRQADRRLPGDPVQARRHGVADRRRARAALPRLLQGRRRRRRHGQVLGDGEADRLRHRDVGDHRGRPGARRLRLRQRVPGRADDARREDHPDLRGHERDPAAGDRADARADPGLRRPAQQFFSAARSGHQRSLPPPPRSLLRPRRP